MQLPVRPVCSMFDKALGVWEVQTSHQSVQRMQKLIFLHIELGQHATWSMCACQSWLPFQPVAFVTYLVTISFLGPCHRPPGHGAQLPTLRCVDARGTTFWCNAGITPDINSSHVAGAGAAHYAGLPPYTKYSTMRPVAHSRTHTPQGPEKAA